MTVVLKFRRQKAAKSTPTQQQLNAVNTCLTLMLTCGNCARRWTRICQIGHSQNNLDVNNIVLNQLTQQKLNQMHFVILNNEFISRLLNGKKNNTRENI